MSKANNNIFPELDFDLDSLESAISGKDNKEISALFLKFLRYLDKAEINYINEEQHLFINRFTEFLLNTFLSEDYSIPAQFHEEFVLMNVVISNMVRITPFITTDKFIPIILQQENNAAKLLPLLSLRNNVQIDLGKIFAAYPYYASLWWGNIISYTKNSCSPVIFNNLKNWVSFPNLEENLHIFKPNDDSILKPVLNSFFQSTYIFPGADKSVRRSINRIVQDKNEHIRFPELKPDLKKIAVFSVNFHKKHAVYRAIAPYLYSLRGAYHLTLIHFAEQVPEMEMDYELFDEIKIPNEQERTVIAQSVKYITSGNYGLMFYPDIGLSVSSIIFSNFRLAPIQVTGSGHPVSTFGSEIDYFIGGKQVEILEDAEKNYSEELILIPGIGMEPVAPDYLPKTGVNPNCGEVLDIMCNWGSNKFYYPHLLAIKEIIKAAKKKLVLHFPGIEAHRLNLLPFTHELKELLADEKCAIFTYGQKKYQDYMELIDGCDFALDSYHFGGYNRIMDMLVCRKPIVVLEGRESYNRAAACILRGLDLHELIASNEREYIAISLRLINEHDYLIALQKKILTLDLKTRVFATGNEIYFKKAIDYLIANHN